MSIPRLVASSLALVVCCAVAAHANPIGAPGYANPAVTFVFIPPLLLATCYVLLGLAIGSEFAAGSLLRGFIYGGWALVAAGLALPVWNDPRISIFLVCMFLCGLFGFTYNFWRGTLEPTSHGVAAWLCMALLWPIAVVGVASTGIHWTLRADADQCLGNMREIGIALDSYALANHGAYPPRLEALAPKYLTSVPRCLEGNSEAVKALYGRLYNLSFGPYEYLHDDEAGAYTLTCHTSNHAAVEVPPGYPKYSSREQEILGVPEARRRGYENP